ncbi:MAG: hypothetical protein ACI91O_001532 [Candidatus Poriferisodalaceae bacterium]
MDLSRARLAGRVISAEEFGPYEWFGETMTETHDVLIISEALDVIDGALNDLLHRELVSTNEITDILLDVRTLLSKKSDHVEIPAVTG